MKWFNLTKQRLSRIGELHRSGAVAIAILWLSLTAIAEETTYEGQFQKVHEDGTVTIRVPTGLVSSPLEGVMLPVGRQPHFEESRRLLEKIAGSGTLTAVVSTDGAIKAMRLRGAGISVNVELVRQGGAWHDHRVLKSAVLADAQREAKAARRGLWGAVEAPVAPWEWYEHEKELAEKLAEIENRKRVEEFRKSLDVPPADRAAALAVVTRAIKARGGAENLLRLERARAKMEVRGDFIESWIKEATAGYRGKLMVELTWELPDRLVVNILSEEVPTIVPGDSFRDRVYFRWNRANGIMLRTIIRNGKESEKEFFETATSLGVDYAVQIPRLLTAVREFLTLVPLTNGERYALRSVPSPEGTRGEKPAADTIEFFPRFLLDFDDNPALHGSLEWLRLRFDPTTGVVTLMDDSDHVVIAFQNPKNFGTITFPSEWSFLVSADKESLHMEIKSLELLDRVDPAEFEVPNREGK